MDAIDPFSISLGALIAVSLVLLVLVVVLLLVGRSAFRFAFGFRTFGVERVHGRVQLKGQFNDTEGVREEFPPLFAEQASARDDDEEKASPPN